MDNKGAKIRYLTGMDWVVNAVDYASKAQSGVGNHSELILELDSCPDPEDLHKALNGFLKKFPIISGYPSRALNLCPYWKIPRGRIPQTCFNSVKIKGSQAHLDPLSAHVNSPFRNKREHLSFCLVSGSQSSYLGMTFDHRLLDAKGAEAFLHLFQQYYRNQPGLRVALTHPHHLNKWGKKFRAGRQINRFLLKITDQPLRTLPFDPRKEPAKFKVIHLDPEQSERLNNKAFAAAGYLMFLPYALAKSILIMHKVFQKRNIPGKTYLIPVPMDTRAKEEAHKKSLFNHFSFFIFKIDASIADNQERLITEIKEQMFEQVKEKIPEAMANASYLMRIASLPAANFFLRLMSKKNFASFSFSYLNNAYQENSFMERRVLNIFHLPRTPKPPGIGIYFNQFADRLNITLSYFEGLLSQEEAQEITASLEALGNEE